MSKITAYRTKMIARKAAAAGMSVADYVARSEADARATRRANELRWDRRSGWTTLMYRAMAMGHGWAVCQ